MPKRSSVNEVIFGQAATVEVYDGTVSISGNVSSVMTSVCMRCGEVHESQHVGLGIVDDRVELRPLASKLIGDVTRRLASRRAIDLDESLAECGRDHALLSFWDVGHRVAHAVNLAPLPCRTPAPGGSPPSAFAGVRFYRLGTTQAAAYQALQERRPESLSLRRPKRSRSPLR